MRERGFVLPHWLLATAFDPKGRAALAYGLTFAASISCPFWWITIPVVVPPASRRNVTCASTSST